MAAAGPSMALAPSPASSQSSGSSRLATSTISVFLGMLLSVFILSTPCFRLHNDLVYGRDSFLRVFSTDFFVFYELHV
ncbi:hypothetical protein L6452_01348 [Arctium lappa]|uniref:Uncharacterized protein n=1 Tax=Arctium lappa TaxID=4217 RepID=A0ACB9FGE7_ARCLA|nr:hypothetical protein L6452_01348 [Arctium lappa]